MSTKDILVGVKVTDTSDLDKVAKKIQDLQRQSSQFATIGDKATSAMGDSSPFSERARRIQETENRKSVDRYREEFNIRERFVRSQQKEQESIDRALKSEKLSKKEINDLTKQRLDNEERIKKTTAEQVDLLERAKKLTSDLSGFKGTGRPETATGGAGGGGAGGTTAGGGGVGEGDGFSAFGMLKKGFGAALAAYAITQTVQRATSMAAFVLKHEQEKSRTEATVAQLGFDVSGRREELSGEYLRSKVFAEERAEGRAESQTYGSQLGTRLKNILGIASHIIGDTLSGDLEQKGTQGFIKQKLLESEKESIESAMAKNPEMMSAFDFFLKNKNKFLQSQQLSGMTDEQLTGPSGFLSMAQGMFTQEQKFGAMGQIYGAGGSTAQGRQAAQALQLQREFGLQGSANVLGRLSAGIGGGQVGSDSVVRKILAEAFTYGLDASNFSRETEKFVQVSTDIIEQSGARTEQEMSRVIEGLGRMLPAGASMKEIQGISDVHRSTERSFGEGASPYHKAVQLQVMRSDPNLSKLSEQERMTIMEMSPDEIRAGSKYLEGAAETAGFSDYQSFVNKILGGSGIKTQSTALPRKYKETLKKYGQLRSKKDEISARLSREDLSASERSEYSSRSKDIDEQIKGMDSEMRAAVSMAQQQGMVTMGKGAQNYEVASYELGRMYSGEEESQQVKDWRGKKPVGRPQGAFDAAQVSEARGEQEELQNYMKHLPRFNKAVEEIATESEKLAKSLKKINENAIYTVLPSAPMSSQEIMSYSVRPK